MAAAKPAAQAQKKDKEMGAEVQKLGGYRPSPAARFPRTIVERTEIVIVARPRKKASSGLLPPLIKFGPY